MPCLNQIHSLIPCEETATLSAFPKNKYGADNVESRFIQIHTFFLLLFVWEQLHDV